MNKFQPHTWCGFLLCQSSWYWYRWLTLCFPLCWHSYRAACELKMLPFYPSVYFWTFLLLGSPASICQWMLLDMRWQAAEALKKFPLQVASLPISPFISFPHSVVILLFILDLWVFCCPSVKQKSYWLFCLLSLFSKERHNWDTHIFTNPKVFSRKKPKS